VKILFRVIVYSQPRKEPRELPEIRRRFGESDDPRDLREPQDRLRIEVLARPGRHVVEDEGKAGRVGDRGEVAEEPFLAREVVGGSHGKDRRSAGGDGVPRPEHRFRRVVASRPRDHGHAAVGDLDDVGRHGLALVSRERGRFALRRARDEEVDLLGDLPVDEGFERGEIDPAPLVEGSDESGSASAKIEFHALESIATGGGERTGDSRGCDRLPRHP